MVESVISSADMTAVWPEIVAFVAHRRGDALSDGVRHPAKIELDGAAVVVTTRTLADALAGVGQAPVLAEALYQTIGGRWTVAFRPQGARCGASVVLLRSEIRKVRETPEVEYYRDDDIAVDLDRAEASPHTPYCQLSGPHEQHAAQVGSCEVVELDIWFFWRTGLRDSRKLDQPGSCQLLPPIDPDLFCLGPAGHDGECQPSHDLRAGPGGVTPGLSAPV